jgi:hypothetical protein
MQFHRYLMRVVVECNHISEWRISSLSLKALDSRVLGTVNVRIIRRFGTATDRQHVSRLLVHFTSGSVLIYRGGQPWMNAVRRACKDISKPYRSRSINTSYISFFWRDLTAPFCTFKPECVRHALSQFIEQVFSFFALNADLLVVGHPTARVTVYNFVYFCFWWYLKDRYKFICKSMYFVIWNLSPFPALLFCGCWEIDHIDVIHEAVWSLGEMHQAMYLVFTASVSVLCCGGR